MLRSLKDLCGYRIRASDGEAGSVEEFYFDDDAWVVRYVIVDLGSWLRDREVVVSPMVVGRPDWEGKLLLADLTKEQLKSSPPAADVLPVSQQGDGMLRAEYAEAAREGKEQDRLEPASTSESPRGMVRTDGRRPDPHLRSTKEVFGYRIQSSDGHVGSVQDLIVDDESWNIRYMVANTGVDPLAQLTGRRVLVAPAWIESVAWEEKAVHLGLSRETIEHSPDFDPNAPVNREYEVRLYDYYGRPKYWL